MSSLLQHHGGRSKDGRKVELLFILKPTHCDACKAPLEDRSPFCHKHGNAAHYTAGREMFTGPDGKRHAVLYRAFRRPVGMFGCWVVFRYNGEEHVPDLSVPIDVDKLPRDATKLSEDEAMRYWTRP